LFADVPCQSRRCRAASNLANTASRINHRNCIGSDDEANIGNGPVIAARHEFHHARVNEKTPGEISLTVSGLCCALREYRWQALGTRQKL